MSSILTSFTVVLMSIVFLSFKEEKQGIHQSDETFAMRPEGFVKEEIANLFGILAIVIFGIWGVLISLGIYNF